MERLISRKSRPKYRKPVVTRKKEKMERDFSLLIVDDDEELASNLKDILEDEGYKVVSAHNGQSALTLCCEKKLNLALIDIKLPDISGIALIEELSDLCPDMEHIIITGYASVDTALAAVGHSKVIAYEIKPLDIGYLLSLVRQVAERQQAEEAFRVAEQNFRNSLDGSPLGIRIITAKGELLYANQAILDIYGYNSIEELANTAVKKRYTPQSYAQYLERREKRQRGEAVPQQYEIAIIRKGGEVRNLKVTREEVIWDGKTQFQTIYEDITERKRAEERLRALSRQLVQSQENERRAIARELHDQIGQSLTVLKLLLDKEIRSSDKNISSDLGEAQSIVSEIITQVRNLSLELRPAMLDDLGLLPTLFWYFERYTNQTKIRVNFKHSGLQRQFQPEVNTTAYRILQEALTNVVRHAGTNEVTVNIWADKNKLYLHIEDQGVGFTTVPLGTSSGLNGMRERAHLLGGTLAIESTPGVGTCLTAEIPLTKQTKGKV